MSRKETKNISYVKYTAATYLDSLISMPLAILKKGYDIYDFITKKEKNSWQEIKEYTPGHKFREKLRQKYDTEPGTKYLQSNLLGAVAFMGVGLPAAELAQSGIDELIMEWPEISKNLANSTLTLAGQYTFGIGLYMVNEVRTNRYKYVDENNKLKLSKIWHDGYVPFIKAGLTFDIPYIGLKLGGQSFLLSQDKDPWEASAIFDSFAIPLWYVVAIPLGLKYDVIKTKFNEKE